MKQVSSLKPGAAKATALLFTFVGGSLMGGMMISSLKDNSPQKAQVLGSALPNTAHAAPAADTAPFLSARWASLLAGVVAPQWAGATVYPEVTFHHGRPTMHILVTGGAGFIGSHAVLRLMDDGHAVTVIDNFSRGNAGAIEALMRQAKPGQLRFVWMDLADSHKLNSLFTQSDFDVVIHFAAVAYVGESYANPILYYRNITSNTIKLLHAMEHGGVTKLVYSSTCATYGNAKTMPITESTPQIPVSPYGRSKLMAEQVIKDFTALSQNNFQAVLLRYFNVIGSDPLQRVGESPREALAQKYGRISGACFDAAIGKRKQLTILGTDHATPDGTCVRDYIHVVDLVDAHIKAFSSMTGSARVKIFNVGTGNGYSVREFVAACKNVTNAPIKVVESAQRPGDAALVYADPTKIKTELGWEPKYTNLRDTLETSWRFFQKYPNGYERKDNSAVGQHVIMS